LACPSTLQVEHLDAAIPHLEREIAMIRSTDSRELTAVPKVR
jgi:hypothetical protein